MLRNEFPVFEERLEQACLSSQLLLTEISDARCARIRQSWEDAILSDATEHSLVRYFYYQLELIVKLSDSIVSDYHLEICHDPCHVRLLHLINHLELYYSCYLNPNAVVPRAYWHIGLTKLERFAALIRAGMQSPAISSGLSQMFLKCLEDLLNGENYTFRFSGYFFNMIKNIAQIDFNSPDAEEQLIGLLLLENFNHLSFFVFLQDRLQLEQQEATDKLSVLHRQKQRISGRPEAFDLVYDPRWPSLKVMLTRWLEEEILITDRQVRDALNSGTATVSKIPIELPLAHLAYLTRLFVGENVFGNLNLKGLFKFYTDHFQTKRQPAISQGGFSKAYYSTDQQTAARVRALLEKMLSRIKRDFFLVMVVVSTIAHFYLGTH